MAVTVDTVLQSNMKTVSEGISQARQTASRIRFSDYLGNVSKHNLDYQFNKPYIPPPSLSLDDLIPDGLDNDFIKWLDTEAEKLIDKYFPLLKCCLRTLPEEWLCKVISGEDPYGNSEQMFRAVWNQARDNAYKTAQIEKNQIYAEFSSRGFTLPMGAMVAAIQQTEENASDTISAANKEIMINEINVKLDLLKFAVEQAINLKIALLKAMADFYKLFMDMPNYQTRIAEAKANIYNAYYRALGSYYDNELGFERLKLTAATAQLDAGNTYEKLKIEAYRPDPSFNPAVARAAESFAQIAAAASNANSILVAQMETVSDD
ncbi:hypothetical protein MTZ49_07235 [Entomomonas sp. E2T0]|uniref:hypothetical protein n=1 Tax=Entomomonas sp. E2T0 TaxID=2930213 RepID=UPI0022281A27|nr:hypothetical protein [Entomomonas sp. E2T0]UYZ85332.1 hypothetical protein MTZ49_07235 [Entomomonas sp. E2T0]